jgi:hypothetical protein
MGAKAHRFVIVAKFTLAPWVTTTPAYPETGGSRAPGARRRGEAAEPGPPGCPHPPPAPDGRENCLRGRRLPALVAWSGRPVGRMVGNGWPQPGQGGITGP